MAPIFLTVFRYLDLIGLKVLDPTIIPVIFINLAKANRIVCFKDGSLMPIARCFLLELIDRLKD